MAQTVELQTWYTIASSQQVTLPDGKCWSDVSDYYVKWDKLHVCIKGEWIELDFESELDFDSVDYKRPCSLYIYPVDNSGFPDYDTLLGERS